MEASMKPLSVEYYSLNNKRKILSMIISIGFSIALIFSLSFLVDEIKHSNDLTELNPLKLFSKVGSSVDMPLR